MQQKLLRVFHHYEEWEEYRWGMWRIIDGKERERLFPLVRELILDLDKFRKCMEGVLMRWPISCQNSLTHRSNNRAAWLWHAGACMVTGAPEDVTRSVWMTLTDEHRAQADHIAWDIVSRWENDYLRGEANYDAHLHLPTTRLPPKDQAAYQIL